MTANRIQTRWETNGKWLNIQIKHHSEMTFNIIYYHDFFRFQFALRILKNTAYYSLIPRYVPPIHSGGPVAFILGWDLTMMRRMRTKEMKHLWGDRRWQLLPKQVLQKQRRQRLRRMLRRRPKGKGCRWVMVEGRSKQNTTTTSAMMRCQLDTELTHHQLSRSKQHDGNLVFLN